MICECRNSPRWPRNGTHKPDPDSQRDALMSKRTAEQLEKCRDYARRRRDELRGGPPRPKRGYKQTAEHAAKRRRAGEQHYRWTGNAISRTGGRKRALKLYPENVPCEKCGAEKSERHHRDGDTANNSPGNIARLCGLCHKKEHADILARLGEIGKKNLAKANETRSANLPQAAARSGDSCPCCGRPMRVSGSQKVARGRRVYIACLKHRGGCGHLAGGYTE